MILNAALLRKHNVCTRQLDLFIHHFGEENVPLDELKKYAGIFGIDWAAEHLLDASSLKIYNETCDNARKIYNETCDNARKICDETCLVVFAKLFCDK